VSFTDSTGKKLHRHRAYHCEPNAEEAKSDESEIFSAEEFTDTGFLVLVAWYFEIFIEIIGQLTAIEACGSSNHLFHLANTTLAQKPSGRLRNDKPAA
jgi:hypothetical protein